MTNETKGRYAAKRLIHISKEQEERMAAQSAQKIQAFAAEAAQVQGRRCELMGALLVAHVGKVGIDKLTDTDVETCRKTADLAVDLDSKQKWTGLKALFLELGVEGPQPHLEWAAKQVGVTLFDPPAEESLVQLATVEAVEKVIQ